MPEFAHTGHTLLNIGIFVGPIALIALWVLVIAPLVEKKRANPASGSCRDRPRDFSEATFRLSVVAHERPEPCTWILTGSPENFAVTKELGFKLVGAKERRRRQALEMEPGDRVVFYITRVMAFGASVLLTSEMFEDRTPVWPGKPGKADPYPWRFEAEPELVLDDDAWLPAIELKDRLDHIKKWPADHWKLAFQGQLRTVSANDARVLLEAMQAASATSSAA